MGNISVSLPSDGQTIDVADYNTPVNTIVNEINGGLDNSNIAAAAAIAGTKLADTSIPNVKLATGAGNPGGAWTAWTPSYTNLTIGNGTVVAVYSKIGRTVHFRYKLTLGSTSSVGSAPTISLPVALESVDSIINSAGRGSAGGSDNYMTTRNNTGGVTDVRPAALGAGGTYATLVNISSTVPGTWATGNILELAGSYEAAS